MANTTQVTSDSQFSIIKLKNSLEELIARNKDTSDSSSLLSDATALFKDFFDNLSDPEFKPIEFSKGDTPRSLDYNTNLQLIYNDISRFYTELNNLSSSNIKSYNFSQVVTNEILNRAQGLASTVLDLNILSNFVRGDVIVAGDDFLNLDNIDSSAGLSSSQAELISNGAGVGLARSSTNNLTDNPNVGITVLPIKPGQGGVNTGPTPGNFDRFYEGNYYNFLGAARPEGGEFNIQFIIDPNQLKTEAAPGEENTKGIFLEYGASEDQKAEARKKMLDGNPDTFWECEYVVRLQNPLIPDVSETLITDDNVDSSELDQYSDPEAPSSAGIQIDVDELNNKALSQDVLDLSIDIIVSLPQDTNINFVVINPVIFSKQAFVEVEDISTINSTESEFTTVDNWNSIRFAKTITPEANEYLTDSQVAATLAPSRYNYSGQGIYPFPTRIANKVKIRLTVSQPSSQVYEKTYALLKNNIEVTTTVTTTTTKGALRF